jgi:hypothetical protein
MSLRRSDGKQSENLLGISQDSGVQQKVVKRTSDVFGQPCAETFQINESGKESRDMNVGGVNLHRDECFQARQTKAAQGIRFRTSRKGRLKRGLRRGRDTRSFQNIPIKPNSGPGLLSDVRNHLRGDLLAEEVQKIGVVLCHREERSGKKATGRHGKFFARESGGIKYCKPVEGFLDRLWVGGGR